MLRIGVGIYEAAVEITAMPCGFRLRISRLSESLLMLAIRQDSCVTGLGSLIVDRIPIGRTFVVVRGLIKSFALKQDFRK